MRGLLCLLLSLACALLPAADTWTKLADPPADLLGREMPPGADAAWCYVPEWKGFLLYGGYSNRHGNEGWVYLPATNELKLLWADDSLRYDAAARQWRALLPREIVWSHDRPGPARGIAAVYLPPTGKVLLFGGHPSIPGQPWRLGGRGYLGNTKLGTWELDPATLKFKFLGEDGPVGLSRGAYDAASNVVVALPAEGPKGAAITWVFKLAENKWEARKTAANPPVQQQLAAKVNSAARASHPNLAWDAAVKQCVYYAADGATWLYDAAANTWTCAAPASSPPGPRRHAAMAFVPELGKVLLHGGSHSDPMRAAFYFHPKQERADNAVTCADTWVYDAAGKQWTELQPAAAPPPSSAGRGCFAYDADRKACVLYDIADGIWAFGPADPYGKPAGGAPVITLSPEVLAAQAALASRPRELSPAARDWQDKIRALPDNAYLGFGDRVLSMRGSENIAYDPAHRCVVWIAGCMEGVLSTAEDGHFQNEVMLFDMETGTLFQRRATTVWKYKGFDTVRPAGGCERGFCYDSKRKVIWTAGGVAGGVATAAGRRGLQYYSLATDTFGGPETSQPPGQAGNSGYIYEPLADQVLVLSGGESRRTETWRFDLATGRPREGAKHPWKFTNHNNVGYDPELGVILVTPVPKGYKPGDPAPNPVPKTTSGLVMGAYAYDAAKDVWRDLAPQNSALLDDLDCTCAMAYDSLNRAMLLIENPNTLGTSPPKPARAWVLDLKANAWSALAESPPLKFMNNDALIYDANHNVFVLGCNSPVILYRYKGGCPEGAFLKPGP